MCKGILGEELHVVQHFIPIKSHLTALSHERVVVVKYSVCFNTEKQTG